jgi:exonuclease III
MTIKKILYLNAHLFRGTIPAFFYRKLQYNDNKRCGQICDYILSENYDVVLLSEIWSSTMKLQIMARLVHQYPNSYVPPRNCKWYQIGPEQIILSKEVINESMYENLRNLSSWDRFSVKKICSCVIGDYFICTTHFDTGCMMENLTQLNEYIVRNSYNRRVIVAGDFNIAEAYLSSPNVTSELYNNMRSAFDIISIRDPNRMLEPNFVQQPFYTVDETNNTVANHFSNGGTDKCRIDYFFTRGITPIACSVINLPLSDHYGISLTI